VLAAGREFVAPSELGTVQAATRGEEAERNRRSIARLTKSLPGIFPSLSALQAVGCAAPPSRCQPMGCRACDVREWGHKRKCALALETTLMIHLRHSSAAQ